MLNLQFVCGFFRQTIAANLLIFLPICKSQIKLHVKRKMTQCRPPDNIIMSIGGGAFILLNNRYSYRK